jgi:hypothetical protein
LRQVEQQAQRFAGDAVLRVVQVNTDCRGCETLAAPGVFGEKRAQVEIARALVMLL